MGKGILAIAFPVVACVCVCVCVCIYVQATGKGDVCTVDAMARGSLENGTVTLFVFRHVEKDGDGWPDQRG